MPNDVKLTIAGDSKGAEQAVQRTDKALGNLQQRGTAVFDRLNGAATFLTQGLQGLGDSVNALINLQRESAIRADTMARAQNDVAQAALDIKQAGADGAQALVDMDQALIDGAQSGLDAKQAFRDVSQALIDMEQASLDGEQAQVDLRQAQRDGAQAALDLEQATRDAAQSVIDLRQAQQDLTQSGIDAKQSLLDQEQAARDYRDAVREFGTQSREARQALLDLEQAQADGQQAQIDATQATEDRKQAELDGKQATEDRKQAELDAVQATVDAKQAMLDAKQATEDYQQAQLDLEQAQLDAAQAGADARQSALDYQQAQLDLEQSSIDATGAQIDLNEAQRAAIPPNVIQVWAQRLSDLAPLLFTITGLQWAFNIAVGANPIGLIILAIGAMVAAIVWLVQNFDIVKAAGAIAWDWIKDRGEDLLHWIQGVPDMIGRAFSGLINIITWPFRTAFNGISDAWNNTIGKLSWSVPSWVPGIGGQTIGAPKLPRFHTGVGMVPGRPGTDVLAVLQPGERVSPAGSSAGAPVPINVGGSRFIAALLDEIAQEIRDRGGEPGFVLTPAGA